MPEIILLIIKPPIFRFWIVVFLCLSGQHAIACLSDELTAECANLVIKEHHAKRDESVLKMKCPLKIDHYENRPSLTIHLYRPQGGFIFAIRTSRPNECVDIGEQLLLDFKDGSTMELENSSKNCKGDIVKFLHSDDDTSKFLGEIGSKTIAVIRSAKNDAIRQNLSHGESDVLRTTLQCFRDIVTPAAPTTNLSWTPPANPDPDTILNEARTDRQQGRYKIALAKHIWFHENALKIDRSLTGVRLSFALGDWRELANRYAPALQSLEEIRDLSETRVRMNKRDFEAFQDFAALNRELLEEEKTATLFKWAHDSDPVYARAIYPLARDSLVQLGDFDLCSKFTGDDPHEKIIQDFRESLKWADEQNWSGPAIDSFRQLFSYDAALTIAILANVGRSAEARQFAELAEVEWNSPFHQQRINKALAGTPPERPF